MMDSDDLEPKRPNLNAAMDLESLSIEALGDYITELEAEIQRVREAIDAKKAAHGAADAFFKN